MSVGDRLLAVLKAGCEFISPVKLRAHCITPDIDDLQDLHLVEVRCLDASTSNDYAYPILDWVRSKRYLLHTLCLHGGPDLGKSVLARIMVGKAVIELHRGLPVEPYAIVSRSCDGLSLAVADNLMGPGIPILFDEVKVGEDQGCRVFMNLENVKKVVESTAPTTLEARYRDIHISYPELRLSVSRQLTGIFASQPKFGA